MWIIITALMCLFGFYKFFNTKVQYLFNYNYIYNLSWEDPKVDQEILKIGDNDKVLTLTTGGDNILNYLTYNPKKIYSVDINKYQNILLDMKIASIKILDHNEFYEMFFNSNQSIWFKNKNKILAELKLKGSKKFWMNNGDNIFKNFIYSGYVKYLFYFANIFFGETFNFLKTLSNSESLENQILVWNSNKYKFEKTLKLIEIFYKKTSFLYGVPKEQLDLNPDVSIMEILDHILHNNLLKENYFYYGYINGKLLPEHLPKYCNSKYYYDIKKRLNRIVIINNLLIDACKEIPKESLTKVSLLDHMDWLSYKEISDELFQLSKCMDTNHKIIYRSFSDKIPHNCLEKYTIWSDIIHKSHLQNKDRIGMYYSVHELNFKNSLTTKINNRFLEQSTFCNDLKMLYNMYFKQMNFSTDSHQDRLDSFYTNQADYYDIYRSNMLHGRDELIMSIPFHNKCNWLDIGGGTGYSVKIIDGTINNFSSIDVIEYSKSMFKKLKENLGLYRNVNLINDDIHKFNTDKKYDIISFSYSLVMIPKWRKALSKSIKLLNKNGIIAITDFYAEDNTMGKIWKWVFSHDGVYLNDEINKYIENNFKVKRRILDIKDGGFPYIPFLKCKYFIAIYELQ